MSENNRHRRVAAQMAERYGVDPELYVRLIARESGWDPNARGASGEIGYSQIMAETAASPGFGVAPIRDRSDPIDNLRFGAEYLGALIDYYDGDYSKALMAYNGGAGNVDRGSPSEGAQRYASELLGGSSVAARDKDRGSRPSGNAPMAEDRAGMNAIREGILALAGEGAPRPARVSPPSGRYGSSSRMSPLSGTGIPGLGAIKAYSTPGGVESLYRKK